MRPSEVARVSRRIAKQVNRSASPSQASIQQDLADLIRAVDGDEEATKRLSSKFASGIPALGQLEQAFVAAGHEAPEMYQLKRGLWIGSFQGVKVSLYVAPNGEPQKVLVAGKPVRNWNEAVQSAAYHMAMADNGTPEDPEDIEEATEAVGSPIVECPKCHGPVNIDEDFQCKKCGLDFVTCPGCGQPYPMAYNEDDHCPLCGYSSWSELPEDVADEWTTVLVDAAKKAAETRQPVPIDFQGFKAQVTVEEGPTGMEVNFLAADNSDADSENLEAFLQEPTAMLSGGLDEFLWKKNHEPMQPLKPYKGKIPVDHGQ